jgi:hypothetical protein
MYNMQILLHYTYLWIMNVHVPEILAQMQGYGYIYK